MGKKGKWSSRKKKEKEVDEKRLLNERKKKRWIKWVVFFVYMLLLGSSVCVDFPFSPSSDTLSPNSNLLPTSILFLVLKGERDMQGKTTRKRYPGYAPIDIVKKKIIHYTVPPSPPIPSNRMRYTYYTFPVAYKRQRHLLIDSHRTSPSAIHSSGGVAVVVVDNSKNARGDVVGSAARCKPSASTKEKSLKQWDPSIQH